MNLASPVVVYLRAFVVITWVALLLPVSAAGQLRLVEYATGFSRPLGMVQDPLDPSVQFVLEKFGTIWVLKNGVRQAQPFIDLTSVVMEDSNGERGLLGLAFPPDAAWTGRAFIFFSSRNGRGDSIVARFTRVPGDPLRLDPASRFDLEFTPGQRYIEQPDDIHKAGKMLFGADGYLYIGVGDGGPIWDPYNTSQSANVLLGKILRIDVNVPDSDPKGYVVPPGNPFVDMPGARPEIWALGLRNPWRFSLDDPARGGTGALVIADVGQDDWEEVNYQPAGVGGRNYGWSVREGRHDLAKPDGVPATPPPTITPLTDPIYEYPHGASFGNSITGGHVYRGFDLAPSFQGRYFFAEFIFRRLFSMPLTLDAGTGEAAPVDPAEVANHTTEVGGQEVVGRIASVDIDARGELYLIDHTRGKLLKLTMDSDNDTMPDGWEARFGLDPLSAVGPNGAGGDLDNDGRTNAQEFAAGTHPSNVASLTRYLAEGSSSSFFDTTIGIANPGAQPASVLLRFLRTDGVVITWPVTIPSLQHATVRPVQIAGLGAADFSTVIETDREVVVERTMTWSRASRFGSHSERAVSAPSTTWFLAEGATHGAFDTFYLIENPNETTANVQVTYLRPNGLPPIVRPYDVEGHTRKTIWVDDQQPDLAETDVSASIAVTNGVGIIVERAMYRTSHNTPFMAGHDSAGVTAPAAHWFFAEGATGSFFDMFLLLANPGASPARVTVRYLLPGGALPVVKEYTLNPRSRTTINVEIEDDRLADAAVAMVVDADVAIVAERSMYWPGPPGDGWLEAHNSAGATETGTAWTVAGGEQGGAFQAQTYVLIANTSAFAGTARITVMREGGTPLVLELPLQADSRTNVGIGEFPEFAAVANGRFGVLVESLGATPAATAQIVVERATYTNDAAGTVWGAGSNSLATRIR